jgi:hypothetical protein
MIDFSATYEAPISLDAARMIGTVERRPALWKFFALVIFVPIVLGLLAEFYPPVERLSPSWLKIALIAALPIAVLWCFVCYAFSVKWGQRDLEYWFKVCWRFIRLPNPLHGESLKTHHAVYRVDEHKVISPDEWPGGVVEVKTINLAMRDAATLASFVQRLHAFYIGLRWPIQIVVRSTMGEQIERRWFIAVRAPTEQLLGERQRNIVSGLARAGLSGRPLNGDLYASLQECWASSTNRLSPLEIKRKRGYVILDRTEYIRGLLLTKWPRTIEPNWLAPIIDGDLCCDFSLWLDPVDNTEEAAVLADRINEWETAQVLNLGRSGYRDPDVQESIIDAQRTRLMLRQRKIRVFRGSVAFVVRGKSEAEMYERERLLSDQLRESVGDDAVLPLDFEHDRAPLLAVPTGKLPAMYPLQIVSPAAALTYPFSNSSIRMAGGVECGLSIGSRRVNKLNLFDLGNPHVVIIGTSGAGKGYWVKVFLWRMLKLKERVKMYIIQTEKDEYGPLIVAAGKNGVRRRIDHLAELERLIQPGNSHYIMKPEAQLTLIDLTHMPSDQHGDAIAWLLETIQRTAEWFPSSKHAVVLDELGIVMNNETARKAINIAYRRFRSVPNKDKPSNVSRIAMIGMTQLPTDFLGDQHPDGKVYMGLAETHLYLRQKPSELEVTKSALNLTPDEVAFLQTADSGDALLVAGQTRVALHLQANSQEHELART